MTEARWQHSGPGHVIKVGSVRVTIQPAGKGAWDWRVLGLVDGPHRGGFVADSTGEARERAVGVAEMLALEIQNKAARHLRELGNAFLAMRQPPKEAGDHG